MRLLICILAALLSENIAVLASDDFVSAPKRRKLNDLTIKEVGSLSQEDPQAREKILAYFEEKARKGLFLLLSGEKSFLKQLILERWKKYLEKYHPVFVRLCLAKARWEPAWILPPQVKEQVLAQAKDENANAQYNLAWMYGHGCGVEKKKAEAVRWYRRAADQGHAAAQYNLGMIYEEGRGVARDKAEAAAWYRLAADQEYAAAQCQLGVMYEEGQGVAKSEVEAVKWFRLAADQGHANAQYNLAVMYEEGRGLEKSEAEAERWYLLVADQGDADAQYNLGVMYARGRGIEENHHQAIRWYLNAAQKNLKKQQKEGLKKVFQKMQDISDDDNSYIESVTAVEGHLHELYYGAHLLEMHLNDPQGIANSCFAGKGSANPLLHKHYQVLVKFEEKVLKLLKGFSLPGFMIDSWDLVDHGWFQAARGAEKYFADYSFENHRYLAFGKEAVEHADELRSILKGEDEDWQLALESAGFLGTIFEDLGAQLKSGLIRLQTEARDNLTPDQHNPQEVETLKKRVDANQGRLDGLEVLKAIPQHLAILLRRGTYKRNQDFEKEYPGLV